MALVVSLVLSQAPVVSVFDDGAVLGRVCRDTNADGACQPDEPGMPVRLLMENGLEARTDDEGQFHFAGLSARAPDERGGGRLLPGRHRLTVDRRLLPRGAVVRPEAITFEVPTGGVALVEFAVQGGAAPQLKVALDGTPRPLELLGGEVHTTASLLVPPDAEVRARGVPVDVRAGRAQWPIRLHEGANAEWVTVTTTDGSMAIERQSFDVVRRQSAWLVIPRALERVGVVHLPVDRSLPVRAELPQGTVMIAGEIDVVANGREEALLPLSAHEVTVRFADPPGTTTEWREPLTRPRISGVSAVGLADVSLGFDLANPSPLLDWHGAGAVRAAWGLVELSLDLDVADSDLEAVRAAPVTLLAARDVSIFERSPDVLSVSPVWADRAAVMASNASRGRLRLSFSVGEWVQLRFGSYRAFWSGTELGRFHRALQAGSLHASAGNSTVGVSVEGFGGATNADPATTLVRTAAHERFEATGGSVFVLRHSGVVVGSEAVRVELREALSDLPVGERHLTRTSDYTLDATSGRLLLAKPLSLVADPGLFATASPSTATTHVLVVDYEYLELGSSRGTFGGSATAHAGPVSLEGGYARDGAYQLLRASAKASLGPVWLTAELARSAGALTSVSLSDDGGLSFAERFSGTGGWAALARARSTLWQGEGFVDASFRWREAGFSDLGSAGRLLQFSGRAAQPMGPVTVFALGDFRDGMDPRFPMEQRPFQARLLGGGVAWAGTAWGVRLEARESQLTSSPEAGSAASGERLSIGLAGSYRIDPRLTVRAGYRQRVWQSGVGEGAFDDSFASLGLEAKFADAFQGAVRAGWGPRLGPQVWGGASFTNGDETRYGAQSFDVDGPPLGERRIVSGVRQSLGPSGAVFVEDVGATDVSGLRLARAIGFSQSLGEGLSVSARYERGVRALVDSAPQRDRDAGGVSFAWESQRVRLFARGEVRRDITPASTLMQYFGAVGGEANLTEKLVATARGQFIHSSRDGLLESRAIEALAALAWRFSWGAVVARYSLVRDRLPGASFERNVQLVSLLPTVKFSRVAIASGANVGITPSGVVLSASVRPSVRVWKGIEVAAEGVRRSSAPDGGELSSLRGEAGYRFDDRFLLAAGFTFFGFSGTGLNSGDPAARQRLYFRAEIAY